jgi:hypothetical protein
MGMIIQRGSKLYLRYYEIENGRRVQRTKRAKGCTTKAQAKAQLTAVEKRIGDGRAGVEVPREPTPEELQAQAEAERRRTISVREIGDDFVERYSDPDLKNPADYRMEAKSVFIVRIYPALGDKAAAAVTKRDVEDLRDRLIGKDYAPQSVTNTLNTLSKLYR